METTLENKSTDYAPVGGIIDSPEALEAYMKQGNQTTEETVDALDKDKDKDKGQQNQNQQNKSAAQQNQADATSTTETEEEEEEAAEYPSLVHFLNEELKLGLNVQGLPEKMSQEQEAEAIATIMRKVQQGYSKTIAQYQNIDRLLTDAEVKAFLDAKQQGKTLKDYVTEYAQSPQGQSSEQVAIAYLKKNNPSMTDDDVKEMVATYKEKGKLEKLEADARKYFVQQEADDAKFKEQKAKQEAEQFAQKRKDEANNFAKFITSQKDVSGIALDDKMKRDVFMAATTVVDDQTGETWLDQALQTDEGVFLAAMGILHMKKLIAGKHTNLVNRKNSSFVDTLFETPDPLQSSSQGGRKNVEVNDALANAF